MVHCTDQFYKNVVSEILEHYKGYGEGRVEIEHEGVINMLLTVSICEEDLSCDSIDCNFWTDSEVDDEIGIELSEETKGSDFDYMRLEREVEKALRKYAAETQAIYDTYESLRYL